ncbi:unnamed protein product [Bursaphelenchus xylophilus]|uniref:(pine wood nematode) hypothetical protein n=1 Tax=Bursaphelenchus xylophilus TaxID=6326 RepID=A0A1I7SWN1_BURXY|nr:unnamed protein product [Bursaphelenchus xylophilus]CAG9099692.1 unnamed protein product [Bursaphelenchus xylophilus]
MDLKVDERAGNHEINRIKEVLENEKAFGAQVFTPDDTKTYVRCAIPDSPPICGALNSGNDMVDKCVYAFLNLAIEVDKLASEARERIYNVLLLYGEDGEDKSQGEVIETMSNFFPFLHNLSSFVLRVKEVAGSILQQLYRFFELKENLLAKAKERPLWRLWRCLGDALVILATVEEIFVHRPFIKAHFHTYKNSIMLVAQNPGQFGLNSERDQLVLLMNTVNSVDRELFSQSLVKGFCASSGFETITKNKPFLERFRTIISDSLYKWDQVAQNDIPDRQRLLVLCNLTVLHSYLVGINADKRLIKQISATQKRLTGFHLTGDLLFLPLMFLKGNLHEASVKCLNGQTLDESINLMLTQQTEQLQRETQLAQEIVNEWKAEMINVIKDTTNGLGNGTANQTTVLRFNVLLKGARLADRVGRLVKCILNAHLFKDRAISRSNALHLFRLIEVMQIVKDTITYYWNNVIEWTLQARQYWSKCFVRLIEGIRQAMSNNSKPDPYNLDVLSAIHLSCLYLSNSSSKQGLMAVGFALDMANYLKNLRTSEILEIDEILVRLDSISMIGDIINRVTDCSFLYFHRSIANIYFESLITMESNADGVKKFFNALDDSSAIIQHCRHKPVDKIVDDFREDIFASVEENLIDKLCTNIENDLRVLAHSHQNIDEDFIETEIFKTKKGKTPYLYENQENFQRIRELIELGPLTLMGYQLSLKEKIEKNIQKVFYELTVVALHDSETYSQMRLLAKKRFNLDLLDSNLPHMAIDQGLDILKVTASLDSFVESYCYDLKEQAFYEKKSATKMLNVMRVKNVVSSIKTRGMGIVHNTLNVAYNVLKKKLKLFSKMMFNEQIKLQLMKDIRYYRDNIDELDQMYPVRRAEKFNASIVKLGTTAKGQTLLEAFRQVIVEIGNTLGFVRMLQSAILNVNCFTAEMESIEDNAIKANPMGTFIDCLNNSLTPFQKDNDYIQLMLQVFSKELRNLERFAHLRNFFILIPPLSINYVEYLFASKAKSLKTSSADHELIFVEDGFPMGVAFILSVLNQDYFFDSVNWFESVQINLNNLLKVTQKEEQTAQRNKDNFFAQTLAIRLARFQEIEAEFDYLSYNLQSSRMFFNSNQVIDDEDEHFLEDIVH